MKIAIPSTFTGEEKNQTLRAYKIGSLARTCAIYGVDEIIVYYDPDKMFNSQGLGRKIVRALKYINTPPYLRKDVFKLEDTEKEWGVFPPLKTYHHVPEEFGIPWRMGIVRNGRLVAGKENYAINGRLPDGEVATINKDTGIAEDPKAYWGYSAMYERNGLSRMIEKNDGFCIVGTSVRGEDIRNAAKPNKETLVIFGSPFRGLQEMEKARYDLMLNTVPGQNTKTVRTEEAVHSTLSAMKALKWF